MIGAGWWSLMCLLGYRTGIHNAQAGTATIIFSYQSNQALFFIKERLILPKTIISKTDEVLDLSLSPVEDVLILLGLWNSNPDISKNMNTFMFLLNLLFFLLSCLFMPHCCLQEHSLLHFSLLLLS